MNVYLDASALVKRYVIERSSTETIALNEPEYPLDRIQEPNPDYASLF